MLLPYILMWRILRVVLLANSDEGIEVSEEMGHDCGE
jgi:hypothetical protein